MREEVLEGCSRVCRITDLPEPGASALGEGFPLKLRPQMIGSHEAIFQAPPRLNRACAGGPCSPDARQRRGRCSPCRTRLAHPRPRRESPRHTMCMPAVTSMLSRSFGASRRHPQRSEVGTASQDPTIPWPLVPCLDVNVET